MSQSKGYSRERELVNKLVDVGFAATRVPGSGGGTKRPLPDIVAGDGHDIYAIEAKARAGDSTYLDEREVYDLVYFSRNFGAQPRIGVRFDHEDWYFFDPRGNEVHITGGGNYRVTKDIARSYGHPIEELAEHRSTTSDKELKRILHAVENGNLNVADAIELTRKF